MDHPYRNPYVLLGRLCLWSRNNKLIFHHLPLVMLLLWLIQCCPLLTIILCRSVLFRCTTQYTQDVQDIVSVTITHCICICFAFAFCEYFFFSQTLQLTFCVCLCAMCVSICMQRFQILGTKYVYQLQELRPDTEHCDPAMPHQPH